MSKSGKSKTESLTTYIPRVLKQVHPDLAITKLAIDLLDDIIDKTVKIILLPIKGKELSLENLKDSISKNLTGELERHAIREGYKAEVKYENAAKGKKIGNASKYANLVFPVPRVQHKIEKYLPGTKINYLVPVFLTAVLEYITAEILEVSGDACSDDEKARITPEHIKTAINKDSELMQTFLELISE